MRIVAADTAVAILDGYYRPIRLVTTAAVIAEPPYTRPIRSTFKHIELSPESHDAIIEELKLIEQLLSKSRINVDVVHVDVSLKALDLSEIRPEDIEYMDLSKRSREALRVLLPLIKPYVERLRESFGISILAIGKESIVVRMAELVATAYSVLFCIRRAIRYNTKVLLGLPRRVGILIEREKIRVLSLEPWEKDLDIWIRIDPPELIGRFNMREYPNPIARGFRVLEVRPT